MDGEEVQAPTAGDAGSSTPFNIMQPIATGYLLQHAQELQQRLNAKELQPSLIEQFMASKGFGFGVQQKALQRQQLLQEQAGLAKYFMQNNQPHMLAAVYQSLKPEEMASLVKADMASPRNQVAKAFQGEINAPVTQGIDPGMTIKPEMLQEIAAHLQGESPGNTITPLEQRAPTPQETISRYGPVSMKYAPAISATQGRTLGDFYKGIQEYRRQQGDQGYALPQPGAPVQSGAPQAEGSIQSTPLPTGTSAQASRQALPASPFIARARAAGVNPHISLALLGNEGSSDTDVSPAGAAGRWQFMPETAKPYLTDPKYGIGIPAERLDTRAKIWKVLQNGELSERVGFLHQKDLEANYPGRPDLVLAAYHGGPGAIIKTDGPVSEWTVNPNWKEKDYPGRPGMYTTEYVRRGMARMQASQASAQQLDTSQMVAGPGAPVPQGQVAQPERLSAVTVTAPRANESPPALTPFKFLPSLGSTKAASGDNSEDRAQTAQKSAESYVLSESMRDPRLAPFAYAEAIRNKALPGPEFMKQFKQNATTAAFMLALSDPKILQAQDQTQQFEAAKTAAYHMLNPPGVNTGGALFDPDAIEKMRAPVELERAKAFAAQLGRGQYTTGSPVAPQERQVEVTQQGKLTEERSKTAPIGAAKGAAALAGTSGVTLGDVHGRDAQFYYDKNTGEQVSRRTPMPEFTQMQQEGKTIELTPTDAHSLTEIRRAIAGLNPILRAYGKIYGPGGIYHDLKATGRIPKSVEGWATAALQTDPSLAATIREASGAARRISRILEGSGRVTDQDVDQALKIIPKLTGFPDSAAVAHTLVRDLLRSFDGELGAVLQNPDYKELHYMHRPVIPVPATAGR